MFYPPYFEIEQIIKNISLIWLKKSMLSLFQKETYLRFKNVTSEGGTTGYIFFPAGYIIFLGWLRLFRSKRSGIRS